MLVHSLLAAAVVALPASAYEIPELKEVMESPHPPGNVADFIRAIPREYTETPILVKNSSSLQGSTAKEPRVLMSNEDGSLNMTFIGHPDPYGESRTGGAIEAYDDIEIIHFDKTTGDYHLYALHLKPGGRARLEGPNPVQCMSCHTNTVTSGNAPPSPLTRAMSGWSTAELQEFVTDKCRGAGPKGTASIGYERYSLLDCSRLAQRHKPGANQMGYLERKWALLLRRQFTAKLLAMPAYPKIKFAAAAAIAGCDNVPLFLGRERAGEKGWRVAGLLNRVDPAPTEDFPDSNDARRFRDFQRRAYEGLLFLTRASGVEMQNWGITEYAMREFKEASVIHWLAALREADGDVGSIPAPVAELRRASAVGDGPFSRADAEKIAGYCSELLAKNDARAAAGK